MFRRRTSARIVNLSIQVIDNYIADPKNPDFYLESYSGSHKCTSTINSFSELTEFYHACKTRIENDAQSQQDKKTHQIIFTLNGIINGHKIKNLRLTSLESLQQFINAHKNSLVHAKAKTSPLTFMLPNF